MLYQIDVSRLTRSGNVSENMIQATREQTLIIEGIINKLEHNKATALAQMQEQLAQYQSAYQQSKVSVDGARRGMEEMLATVREYGDYKSAGLSTTISSPISAISTTSSRASIRISTPS